MNKDMTATLADSILSKHLSEGLYDYCLGQSDVTDREKTYFNSGFFKGFNAGYSAIEAENQRLRESLAIEKDVSEGALIAKQLNFNVDKSVNESLNKLVNHVMKRNQELKDENQRLKDANRWIPTSERLPAHNREYLVTLQIGSAGRPFTGICRFYATAFESANGFGSVVAWRELPEPYQGAV